MPCPTCSHRKDDGVPCGSPALRGKKLCYYHQRDHKRQQNSASAIRRADVLGPRLPRMESLYDVKAALYEVMTAIVDHRISNQRAGRILFDLQQTAASLHKPRSIQS